jgi:hypothetical protein
MKPTPYELAELAVALYAVEHRPGDPPDDQTPVDYFPAAQLLVVAAREYLAAREREAEPPTA